jgi:starvation-inducible DNA-binding protein
MAKTSTPTLRQDLQAVLGQLFDLHVQAVEAHAHFSGTRFIGMQNRLEAVVHTAREASDAVAELVRGSVRDGVWPLITTETAAAVPGLRPGERCATAAVNMIGHRISFVLSTIRRAYDQIGATDQSIADLLGEIGQTVEKQGLLLTAESRRMNSRA